MINGRGRKEIDQYGDNIQSTCLKGDHCTLGQHVDILEEYVMFKENRGCMY